VFSLGLAQINFQTGPKVLNSFYLPYTSGVLWAYARQNEEIREHFSADVWAFRRDPVEETAQQLAKCDVVLYSLYVWNKNYTYELAKRVKEINPAVISLIGGPEVAHTSPSYFIEHPYIDTICVGEGEVCVQELLLMILDGKELPRTHTVERLKKLETPSPYLDGVFDHFLTDYPDIEWVPTLETDRGCPYRCTFCDWGSLTNSKIIKFKLDRVFAEIEWFGKNGLPFINLTNANYGVFKERDNLIADKIVESKKLYSVPTGLSVSYAKNSNADVFGLISKFQEAGVGSGFTLSLQTTTPNVLEAIKRTNMGINDIRDITDLGIKNQISILTEIIVGLPTETLDTIKNVYYDVLDAGLHSGLDVFLLNMLENAPMQQDIEKYQLETFIAHDMFYETNDFNSKVPDEDVPIIKSTSTMSESDIIEAFITAWYITGLHTQGISDIISRALVKQGNTTYKEFYEGLFLEFKRDPVFTQLEDRIRDGIHKWHKTGYFSLKSKDYEFDSWQIIISLMSTLQNEDLLEYAIQCVSDYTQQQYPDTPEQILADYRNITIKRIKQFKNTRFNSESINTFTNLWDYVQDQKIDLDMTPSTYIVSDRTNMFPENMTEHVDNLLFRRRRGYLSNIIDKA